MPWVIAFEESGPGTKWFNIDTIVDCLFFCDIVIVLNTAIIEDDIVITSRREIFCRYLKGFLIIDLLAIFPFWAVT